jgi:catechol 2,3-dioxygenase-like lactoylglutathione lyase family enzyme
MKTHINLATADLDRSVAFYTTLLDAKPAKVLSDYALFITENPGMELALDLRDKVTRATDAHYGIYVETSNEVDRAIDRLNQSGLVASIEREQTCCYAKQSKVWAIDPDGRHWEVYTVHEEAQDANRRQVGCCGSTAEACCG